LHRQSKTGSQNRIRANIRVLATLALPKAAKAAAFAAKRSVKYCHSNIHYGVTVTATEVSDAGLGVVNPAGVVSAIVVDPAAFGVTVKLTPVGPALSG
jgi:hypothetical protein